MHLKFGSYPVLVASSSEIAKEFLKSHDQVFASRPLTAAGKYINYNYSDMGFAPYGPHWHQGRRVFMNELFSAKRMESFEYIRVEEMRASVSRLYELSGKPVVLVEQLTRLTLGIISRMVLGNNCFDVSGADRAVSNSTVSVEELQEIIKEFFILNGVFNIGDWIPWLDFLDLQGYDLIGGGTDTSAITMEWAISELIKRPQLLTQATKELDRVIGRGRWVEEKDIPQLLYIDAIIKETMRKHPVAPLLAPHLAMEDCKVAGYDIPKGTRVFVKTWSIGRDPSLWKQAEEFLPERFLGRNIDVKGTNFELLPFGAGRRMCPGYNLGLKMIQLNLANLLHGFNWKLPDDTKAEDLSMEETYGMTTPRKFPLVAIMEPRLPLHLYKI
ncbi:Cytochrome P450 superfamily protein isoform 2 [Hibiscus syriacus]|uniref:Cytochrome P450 superfamily protein isoform 2 n=1 Tax=Hibiscus syriacus TaxID=106335 RepID=A0A6A2ZAW1_HIBSY|nr:Cytochrome P450 superfamily protein isoform 2 [Hibiscus syriacus]